MIRKIIHIDREKCNGCGACAAACQEGAIEMRDGKAVLTREDYCDGLGNCLPACPADAITFEEREAPAFRAPEKTAETPTPPAGGCPGSRAVVLHRAPGRPRAEMQPEAPASELMQWPVQIRLVPVKAPWFDGARLLVAADCTAYAYANFHRDLLRGHIALIGCPKLDDTDYSEKLTAILRENDIRSVTVARMEVPCCGGLELAVRRALQQCGKTIPWQVKTVAIDGHITEE